MLNYKEMSNLLIGLSDKMPIYIAGHIKPDQDSVCSSLALCEYLCGLGKNANILLLENDKDILNWNPDFSKIKFNVSEEKFVFIALDLNDKKRLGDFLPFFENAEIKINIDHHEGNDEFSDYTLSDSKSSSTSEMIFELLMLNTDFVLNKKIAEYLYSGIYNDTAGFSRRLTSRTLEISQILINSNIDFMFINKETLQKRTMYQFKAMAKIDEEMKFCGFHYSIIDMARDEFKNLKHNQITKEITEDIRKIDEIDIYIVLIVSGDVITGKVMSNKSENANVIASILGGGGHKREAGFTLVNVSVDEILEKLKECIY